MRTLATEPEEVTLNRRISPVRFWTVIILGLISTPLIHDGTKICLTRWQSLFGPSVSCETPAIDAVMSTFDAVYSATRDQSSAPFHNVPWSPAHVLAIGAVWTVCGYMILMRRR